MEIRQAQSSDLSDVLYVEHMAFGQDEEAELVEALLKDPTAQPCLSLLARESGRAVGHVLFTAGRLREARCTVGAVTVSLLAPLAVVPEAQRRGVGGALIARGLELLRESGVDLAFVLGHPAYYPRHGFEPAGRLGFEAPFPIAEKDAGAWMVQALHPGLFGQVRGTFVCAAALNKPEYWRE